MIQPIEHGYTPKNYQALVEATGLSNIDFIRAFDIPEQTFYKHINGTRSMKWKNWKPLKEQVLRFMEYDFVKLKQADITRQKKTHDDCYLAGASSGDFVFEDNEVLVSESCINQWASSSKDKEKKKRYDEIHSYLVKLNSK